MALFKTRLSDRKILSLTGPDTTGFLQGLITQDISGLSTNSALYSCLLTPQGKIIADFFLMQSDVNILLDCDAGIADAVLKKLRFYKLRANVEISDVSGEWRIAAIWSNGHDGLAEDSAELNAGGLPASFLVDPRHESLGARGAVRSDEIEATFSHIEARNVGQEIYDQHRITLGIPVFGKDMISEQSFPLDVNVDTLNGVDYAKGCFVGQEVTSRMKRKGETRKRTWKVSTDSIDLKPETKIMSGSSTIGEITSAVNNHGLALVRLDRLAKVAGPLTTTDGDEVDLFKPDYLREISQ